jgi:hypothetical protein
MSKLPLIAATAVLGLAFVAGATTSVTAEVVGPTPPSDGISCYYNMWHCSYDGDAYWSGCDPRYGQGWIPTSVARAICTQFHPAGD